MPSHDNDLASVTVHLDAPQPHNGTNKPSDSPPDSPPSEEQLSQMDTRDIVLMQEKRIEKLEEQLRMVSMANQELSNQVSMLLSREEQHQVDMSNVQELFESHLSNYEINKKVRTVALVNVTSGNGRQYGNMLLKRLEKLLGKENVFEMSKGPKKILGELISEWQAELRVIVASGDGGVNWVLNTIDELQKQSMEQEKVDTSNHAQVTHFIASHEWPKIAIFPLGVGNDLSRTLKWGGTFNFVTDSLTLFLKRVSEAQTVKLDRWKITLKNSSKTTTYLMSNYFSIGIDAQIALNFHTLRQQNPELCLNRTVNKFWYLSYGIGEIFKGNDQNLAKCAKVTVDGVDLDAESIKSRSLCWVNIPSFSGGTNLWKPTTAQLEHSALKPQEIDDGLIECVSIASAQNIAHIKAGLAQANCVSQGQKWCILFTPTKKRSSLAAQVDGEPFLLEEETEITLERYAQVDVLSGENPSLWELVSHVSKI